MKRQAGHFVIARDRGSRGNPERVGDAPVNSR